VASLNQIHDIQNSEVSPFPGLAIISLQTFEGHPGISKGFLFSITVDYDLVRAQRNSSGKGN
jgi:hypothetical protein